MTTASTERMSSPFCLQTPFTRTHTASNATAIATPLTQHTTYNPIPQRASLLHTTHTLLTVFKKKRDLSEIFPRTLSNINQSLVFSLFCPPLLLGVKLKSSSLSPTVLFTPPSQMPGHFSALVNRSPGRVPQKTRSILLESYYCKLLSVLSRKVFWRRGCW